MLPSQVITQLHQLLTERTSDYQQLDTVFESSGNLNHNHDYELLEKATLRFICQPGQLKGPANITMDRIATGRYEQKLGPVNTNDDSVSALINALTKFDGNFDQIKVVGEGATHPILIEITTKSLSLVRHIRRVTV